MLQAQDITAVQAAADYLRALWVATLASLERELGITAVKGLPFRVVVTVPAMWSDGAQSRTLEAAKMAGIDKERLCGRTTLDLIPEPEAAALATLAKFRGRPNIQPNDVITVCDCGGGTVVSKLTWVG
jgi:molecular chaperone DnaK (HSP70)